MYIARMSFNHADIEFEPEYLYGDYMVINHCRPERPTIPLPSINMVAYKNPVFKRITAELWKNFIDLPPQKKKRKRR